MSSRFLFPLTLLSYADSVTVAKYQNTLISLLKSDVHFTNPHFSPTHPLTK